MSRPAVEPPVRKNLVSSIGLATILTFGLSSCADLEDSATGALSEPSIEATDNSTTDSETTEPAADGGDAAAGDAEEASDEAADANADDGTKIKAGKGTALATLDDLEVKGRAPKTGYDRDEFGPAWADVDRNGCDTRNDILTRDLTDETYKAGTQDCVVLTGNLADPFTATAIAFQRGQSTSTAVQIDHVVALSDAWQKGAQQIDAEARRQFANDPLNLLAVDGPANAAKGDGDAATWLPSNKAFRCQYVARQIAVKKTYKLWVTQAEHDAMERVLSKPKCADEPLPKGGLAPKVKVTEKPATTPEPEPEPEKEPEPESEVESVYYENCTAVREAGADPVRTGDPGYASHLDRDGDGVGCE